MKQIDQLGQVLGKIIADFLGLKNTGQIDAGIVLTQQALKSKIGLNISELLEIPTHEFVNTLLSKKNLTNENIGKIAEILSLLAESNSNESKGLNEKCLAILEYLQQESPIYSLERQWEIDRIKSRL